MMEIEENQKQRFLFLNKLYSMVNGKQNSPVNMYEIGKSINFDVDSIINIVAYLEGEGLVNNMGYGGTITGLVAITHKGIREVDQAHRNPNSPTTKFPAQIVYVGGDYYTMGNVGSNARIQQGRQQTWTETLNAIPNGDTLREQFEKIIEGISQDNTLDEAEKSISQEKTESIANSLANVQSSPNDLHKALVDGNNWFNSKANWVWGKLSNTLKSEAAQKTIGTITESGVKGAIQALIG
jgi:hypothetical protein